MKKTVCVFGHREISETEELRSKLYSTIEKIIVNENAETFLFGSKSRFNSLCLEVVTELKKKYPWIQRIYVRAEYPDITEEYKNYLLENYEDTFFPERIIGAGRAVYVERNYEMIQRSDCCIVYFEEGHIPSTRKSGTGIALEYARKKEKEIILFPEQK